jgi:hypothetical protein
MHVLVVFASEFSKNSLKRGPRLELSHSTANHFIFLFFFLLLFNNLYSSPTHNFILSAFTFTSICGCALPCLTWMKADASSLLEVKFQVKKQMCGCVHVCLLNFHCLYM